MPHRLTRWVLFFLCVGVALAEERLSPAASRDSEDSIAAAKRDFGLLETVRNERLHPTSGIPRLAVPELHRNAEEARAQVPSRQTELPQKPVGWLVEAMENSRHKVHDASRKISSRAVAVQNEKGLTRKGRLPAARG